jgi:hypothetical protein
MERVILVSPKFGISQIAGLRNSVVSTECITPPNVLYLHREEHFSV